MYIAMNRFRIAPGRDDLVEERAFVDDGRDRRVRLRAVMLADELRHVAPGENGRLARGTLRRARHSEIGIGRNKGRARA